MHYRGARHPKIVRLLAAPTASGVRQELKLARSLGIGPSILRGRIRTTTWLYEDPDHPDRVTGTLESPAFTEEDRCLLLALETYEASLCPGCDHPIELAWHSEMDGWFELEEFVCHACTARQEDTSKPVGYSVLRNTMPPERLAVVPPFVLGETTSAP